MQFFRRVKAALDSRETHRELLQLVNLIAQDFIDRASLVRSFIGEGEPMARSIDILGWDKAIPLWPRNVKICTSLQGCH